METRYQRLLLVLTIFILTLALYRDFSDEVTVRRLAHATPFSGGKTQDQQMKALEPANATLGVRTQQSPCFHTGSC